MGKGMATKSTTTAALLELPLKGREPLFQLRQLLSERNYIGLERRNSGRFSRRMTACRGGRLIRNF